MIKKLLIIVGLFYLIPVVVFAKPNVLLEAQAYSEFPWRCVLFEGGTDLYGEVSIGNFSFGLYQYSMWEGKRVSQVQNDEIDPMLFYHFQIGHASITAMLSEYNLPTNHGKKWAYSWDAGIILEFSDLPLSPMIEYYYDFGMYDASYFGLNLSYTFLPGFTAQLTTGINDGQWIEETVKAVYIGISKEFKFFGMKSAITAGNFYTGENYPLVIFKISS